MMGSKDALGVVMEKLKLDIQARGGVSLLIRMMGYDSTAMELIVSVGKGKATEMSAHHS